MLESHHPGRLFPSIHKLPGFKSHISAVKDEEIQCKNNETVYLYAHVQFSIGSFHSNSEHKLHFSFTHKKGNCSSAILWSKFILIYHNLCAQNGHFRLQVFAHLN